MKVLLIFFILLQGEAEPIESVKEVASPKECWVQLGKLMNQPVPKETISVQYSCVVMHSEGT